SRPLLPRAPRKSRRDYQREYLMSKQPIKQPVGAPKGSQNGLTHGIVALKNRIRARRGKNIIDQRTISGQNAIAMRNALIEERGGADSLSVAQLTLIELAARDTYFLDEIDRRIFAVMYKLRGLEKNAGGVRNPKAVGILYGYRQSVARNLSSSLFALGLEKPPPKVKSLDEILSEDDGVTDRDE